VRAADNILTVCCAERTQAQGAEWCVQAVVKLQKRHWRHGRLQLGSAAHCLCQIQAVVCSSEVQVVNCMNNEASNKYVAHV
jgi:hypothetical protein